MGIQAVTQAEKDAARYGWPDPRLEAMIQKTITAINTSMERISETGKLLERYERGE